MAARSSSLLSQAARTKIPAQAAIRGVSFIAIPFFRDGRPTSPLSKRSASRGPKRRRLQHRFQNRASASSSMGEHESAESRTPRRQWVSQIQTSAREDLLRYVKSVASETLSTAGLQDLSSEARRLIETGPAARRTHGEIMLSVIGAVVTNRLAAAGVAAGGENAVVEKDEGDKAGLSLAVGVSPHTVPEARMAVHKRRFTLMG
jgi:hypothetical protein